MSKGLLAQTLMWGETQAMDTPSVVWVRGIAKIDAGDEERFDTLYVCDVVNTGSVVWQMKQDLHPLKTPEDWAAFRKAYVTGKAKHHRESAERYEKAASKL